MGPLDWHEALAYPAFCMTIRKPKAKSRAKRRISPGHRLAVVGKTKEMGCRYHSTNSNHDSVCNTIVVSFYFLGICFSTIKSNVWCEIQFCLANCKRERARTKRRSTDCSFTLTSLGMCLLMEAFPFALHPPIFHPAVDLQTLNLACSQFRIILVLPAGYWPSILLPPRLSDILQTQRPSHTVVSSWPVIQSLNIPATASKRSEGSGLKSIYIFLLPTMTMTNHLAPHPPPPFIVLFMPSLPRSDMLAAYIVPSRQLARAHARPSLRTFVPTHFALRPIKNSPSGWSCTFSVSRGAIRNCKTNAWKL